MPHLKTTHTYTVLQISRAAYDEIRGKLLDADYGHALHREDGFELIDMHGIAVQALEVPSPVEIATGFGTPLECSHGNA